METGAFRHAQAVDIITETALGREKHKLLSTDHAEGIISITANTEMYLCMQEHVWRYTDQGLLVSYLCQVAALPC